VRLVRAGFQAVGQERVMPAVRARDADEYGRCSPTWPARSRRFAALTPAAAKQVAADAAKQTQFHRGRWIPAQAQLAWGRA
jgi:hypothetical protein